MGGDRVFKRYSGVALAKVITSSCCSIKILIAEIMELNFVLAASFSKKVIEFCATDISSALVLSLISITRRSTISLAINGEKCLKEMVTNLQHIVQHCMYCILNKSRTKVMC